MRALLLASTLFVSLSALTGCAALESSRDMVLLLVLVPAALLFGLIFLLTRKRRGGSSGNE